MWILGIRTWIIFFAPASLLKEDKNGYCAVFEFIRNEMWFFYLRLKPYLTCTVDCMCSVLQRNVYTIRYTIQVPVARREHSMLNLNTAIALDRTIAANNKLDFIRAVQTDSKNGYLKIQLELFLTLNYWN